MTDQTAHTAGPWEEAAENLCLSVEKRIEATARKAAESFYEGLLYDTQDYLRENALFNLKAELDRSTSEAATLRVQLNRVADAAGCSPQAYYEKTADHAIQAIECLREKARLIAAAPEMAALVERVAALNPDAGEIGAGMLVQLVTEARRIQAKARPSDAGE